MDKKQAAIYLIRKHIHRGVFHKDLSEALFLGMPAEDFQAAVFAVLYEI